MGGEQWRCHGEVGWGPVSSPCSSSDELSSKAERIQWRFAEYSRAAEEGSCSGDGGDALVGEVEQKDGLVDGL